MTITDKIISVVKGHENRIYSRDEIVEAVINSFPGTNRDSILPADYCYNITNKGISLGFPYPLFEYLNGQYKYLGPNFPYSGDAYWKGVKIGVWENGIYSQVLTDGEMEK